MNYHLHHGECLAYMADLEPGSISANAALSKKRRAEVVVAVKAEDIRKLPPNHPGRWAYATDGIAGWVRWQQGQA